MVNKAFPDNTDTVIFASGENFPDALAASALSGTLNCPIILNPQDSLSDYAKNLLLRIRPTKVFIVGGTAAISSSMEDALNIFLGYKATRLAGDDRTQTADQIARKVLETSTADTCIICSGNDFPDALSVSSYAYAKKMPILLTGSDGKLTEDSLAIAQNFGKAIIIGGTGAVSSDVEIQLAGMWTQRISGADRYETSQKIINILFGGKVPYVMAATGSNFPDALCGSCLAGNAGGAILLVDGSASSLTAEQSYILKEVGGAKNASVIGGEGAVSAEMKAAVDAAVTGS